MPKSKTKSIIKIRKVIEKYPNEFLISPTEQLHCKSCNCMVKHDKSFHVEQHRGSMKHKKTMFDMPNTIEHFILKKGDDFTDQLVKAFLSADIPLHKLNNKDIQDLFQSMGNPLPSQSTCRKKVTHLSEMEKFKVKQVIKGEQFFMIIDESDILGNRYLNILVGILKNPGTTYLFNCEPLQVSPNAEIIVRAIDDATHALGCNREDFCLLISDAARYMTSASKVIKMLYPQILHVTCIAHLLHNCAMKVKTHYDNVDRLIASVKALTLKNKCRKNLFRDIGQPPQPIVTRWASWIKAALYYADNLPKIKEIVGSIDGGGLMVRNAKEAVNNAQLASSLVEIYQCYQTLGSLVVKMEASNISMKEAFHDISNIDFLEDPCGIHKYLQKRFNSNDICTIMNRSRDDIPPSTYALLDKCQPTSASIERSFSMLRKILCKDRNFLPENVHKYLILHYNSVTK